MRSYESAVSPLYIVVKLLHLLLVFGNEATHHSKAISANFFAWDKGGTGMSTLQDIQRLFEKAQVANDKRTRESFIPEIKKALRTCTDLEQKYRTDLALRIPKLLNDEPLHGPHTPIDLAQIPIQIEKGNLILLRPGIGDSGVVV